MEKVILLLFAFLISYMLIFGVLLLLVGFINMTNLIYFDVTSNSSFKSRLIEFYRGYLIDDISKKTSIKKVAMATMYISLCTNLAVAFFSFISSK